MEQITVDIHGKTASEAKLFLEKLIKTCPANTEMTVLHGYNNGTILQDMVRKKLKHKRIKQRIIGLNNGETVLRLH